MITVKNHPLEVLIAINGIKDDKTREKALRDWYGYYIKELTWFVEGSSEQNNYMNFNDMAYEKLSVKIAQHFLKHPNVSITTQFIPALGRVRITAKVGLLKFDDHNQYIEGDRNYAKGVALPPALLE